LLEGEPKTKKEGLMGGGTGGGYSTNPSNLSSNIQDLAAKYPLNSEGKFGTPGKGDDVQHVTSSDPIATGSNFFEKLSTGGKVKDLKNGKGKMATFPDTSTVVFRPVSSSDGSPAMDIVVKGPSGLDYKIHFVKEVG
jgi:hypothetical protein